MQAHRGYSPVGPRRVRRSHHQVIYLSGSVGLAVAAAVALVVAVAAAAAVLIRSVFACWRRPRNPGHVRRFGLRGRDDTRSLAFLDDEPPPRATTLPPAPPAHRQSQQATSGTAAAPPDRSDPPHLTGGIGIYHIERDLLPVQIQPAHDPHRDLLDQPVEPRSWFPRTDAPAPRAEGVPPHVTYRTSRPSVGGQHQILTATTGLGCRRITELAA